MTFLCRERGKRVNKTRPGYILVSFFSVNGQLLKKKKVRKYKTCVLMPPLSLNTDPLVTQRRPKESGIRLEPRNKEA